MANPGSQCSSLGLYSCCSAIKKPSALNTLLITKSIREAGWIAERRDRAWLDGILKFQRIDAAHSPRAMYMLLISCA